MAAGEILVAQLTIIEDHSVDQAIALQEQVGLDVDDRSGSFEPLNQVPKDKLIVLGLVSTKRPSLDKPETLLKSIKTASQFISLERLALSPESGFSTSVIGVCISMEEQKRKLTLVVETAETVWK